MSQEGDKKTNPDVDLEAVKVLGKAIWRSEGGAEAGEYTEKRKDYKMKARRVLRALERQGYVLQKKA